MSASRGKVLALYKNLLRECHKLNSYNFREYALEKTKHDFKANKEVTDPAILTSLLKKAQDNLDVLKRQVLIGHMYGEGHLVIEQSTNKESPAL